LKIANVWNSYGGIPIGTDDFGFSALPSGYGYSDGGFGFASYRSLWWSASDDYGYVAYTWGIRYDGEDVYYNNYSKDNLLSVRCLRDY